MPKIGYRVASAKTIGRARQVLVRAVQCFRALLDDRSQALAAATRAALPRRRLSELREIYTATYRSSGERTASRSRAALQGQLLRRNERREVAIYLCNDALWVADFIDGRGEIVDAVTWFRFNCATPESLHAERRMSRESAIPLSEQMTAKIECLHRHSRTDLG